MRTVVSIFTDKDKASDTVDRLKDMGFNPKDISVLMKDTREGSILGDTKTNTVEGALSGATAGAILGGLAGLVAGFVIPGLGAFLIGGPIAAMLGVTGVAAATASGAATGAVAGGILGALMGFGLTEDEARSYENRINEGGILLAVPATTGEENEIEELLTKMGAQDVKIVASEGDRATDRTTDINARQRQYAYAGAKGGKAKSTKKQTGKNNSRRGKNR